MECRKPVNKNFQRQKQQKLRGAKTELITNLKDFWSKTFFHFSG